MEKSKYYVSVFQDGKCTYSFFADDLHDLVTVKALYRGCEIEVFDIERFMKLSRADFLNALNESREHWNKTFEGTPEPVVEKKRSPRGMRKVVKKVWAKRVKCVETGQVFATIRKACEHLGIPYMTICNCVNRGNPTRGLHFVKIGYGEEDDGE